MVAGPGPARRSRALAALLTAGFGLLVLVPELDHPGVTWDEPEYFRSVERIQEWAATAMKDPAGVLDADRIQAAWDPPERRYFNPHPPVYKEGMAVTEALAGDRLGPVAGYRLSSAILFGVLVGLLTWTVAGVAGLPAGVGAGLSVVLMPRVFGHAHVAASDLPLTLFWALCVLAFASHLRRGGWGRLVLAGIGLGLALGTKFTGWLLPVPLLLWAVLDRRWLPWFATIVIGLFVAWLLVPPAWHDPFGAVSGLFAESLARDNTIPIHTLYAGRIYDYVTPWHQAIVMTLITVPAGILCLALIGCADAAREHGVLRPTDERAALARLALLQVGFFLALMALPSSPNHDGIRLFLPMFPFLAILAGLALGRFDAALQARFDDRAALLGVLLAAAVYLGPAWWQMRHASPYYLSYYNELIGGLPGAEEAGMEVTYWYDAITPEFIAEIEQTLPVGSTVLGFPSVKYFEELQQMGLLRNDLRFSSRLSSDYLLMIARKATLPPPLLEVYENVQPIRAVELDGVELAGLYALNGSREPTEPGTGE
jgi:hypothetical protein